MTVTYLLDATETQRHRGARCGWPATQAERSGEQAVNERPSCRLFRSFVHRLHAWPAAARRRLERGVSGVFVSVSLIEFQTLHETPDDFEATIKKGVAIGASSIELWQDFHGFPLVPDAQLR